MSLKIICPSCGDFNCSGDSRSGSRGRLWEAQVLKQRPLPALQAWLLCFCCPWAEPSSPSSPSSSLHPPTAPCSPLWVAQHISRADGGGGKVGTQPLELLHSPLPTGMCWSLVTAVLTEDLQPQSPWLPTRFSCEEFPCPIITLPTKVHLVKAMVFPVVMYGCESRTVKKAECQIIHAFELWCWQRLLRVP